MYVCICLNNTVVAANNECRYLLQTSYCNATRRLNTCYRFVKFRISVLFADSYHYMYENIFALSAMYIRELVI